MLTNRINRELEEIGLVEKRKEFLRQK